MDLVETFGPVTGLAVRDVVVRVGAAQIGPVTFEVGSGNALLLVGSNGCGKSTLLDALCGLCHPTSGTVWLRGRNVTCWSTVNRMRGGLRRLLQYSPQPDPRLNVRDYFDVLLGPSRTSVRMSADHICARLNLAHHDTTSLTRLSYGTWRLVQLAAVLACAPCTALLDEPLAGIDDARAGIVIESMAAFLERGGSLVTTTHVLEPFASLTRRVITLS
jgi:ABC-type multidrug transport system ATPase subunit